MYWVDSTDANASTGADGSIDTPFSTIDAAVGQCVANQGDVILVKPGHIETVTAAGRTRLRHRRHNDYRYWAGFASAYCET